MYSCCFQWQVSLMGALSALTFLCSFLVHFFFIKLIDFKDWEDIDFSVEIDYMAYIDLHIWERSYQYEYSNDKDQRSLHHLIFLYDNGDPYIWKDCLETRPHSGYHLEGIIPALPILWAKGSQVWDWSCSANEPIKDVQLVLILAWMFPISLAWLPVSGQDRWQTGSLGIKIILFYLPLWQKYILHNWAPENTSSNH